MSRFGAKKGKKLPGAEFTWDTEPGGQPDTAPTPLFPKYTVPLARMLSAREQSQVNLYRELRERFHEGPYYSVLGGSGTAAKKGSAARVHFDPFHGMPSYSEKYQKKKRTLPRLQGRPYVLKFFPRELWQTIQPSYKPEGGLDASQRIGLKRGFEDEEDDEEEISKRRKADDDEDETEERRQAHDEDEEGNDLDEDEEREEEIVDDDFSEDDDEMGGDYNAEQYFDGGEDEGDGDGFADGGGGGDEDTY
ncbi:DNA-directed RNA polymerase III, subunit Rpc31 [Paecilomyces variotii]|uniref:DNA-directed RNA polymerase III subunit n=1 Tax=Byssochlamys spectabilis TaxID=264951 RepID=A0A443I8I6_BYSSP|nr:DNA-directed RNA polymerase III, subunit Rpc31 [Paecilomyces variotii]KAJ9206413.1 hypothetical protein DTO032I3_1843 [Paecilomyces variotii]KAJ9280995.1 hypothetical protein DTO021D3_2049 [Paecilomyces variotii]KAJ9345368.1 hypothetical protein DTO027B6_1899 [Paecilomyces variotii]KAJ9365917.1 hypothetical protein DTO280E4_213 [Paecilomyces variotii]KAJ9386144.1 hypothetical protein DTO032I4_3875 [Paecilomyces variotii]